MADSAQKQFSKSDGGTPPISGPAADDQQTNHQASQPQVRPLRTARRLWTLRIMAIGAGLLFFPVVEIVCLVTGLGKPDWNEDPFVGFSDWQPLFERDGDVYRIAPSRRRFFVDDSFSVEKSRDTFRVFCLGGSTVQGRPFGKETSLTTWLRLSLEQAAPGRHWEVVNCGGISYASYRLVPVLQECLTHQPDLIILCTGHNEFLEDRTYGDVRDHSAWLSAPHHWLARTRSYQVYRSCLESVSLVSGPQRPTLSSDVDAWLDYHNGLNAYHRDESWRRSVMAHFELNVERMTVLAAAASVPLIMVLPPSNLADSPPFKSEHRAGLSIHDREQFDALIEASRHAPSVLERLPLLEKALQIDPEWAALRYSLGRIHESMGQIDEARQEYLAARDQDICPLRIVQPMEASLVRVAEKRHVPLIDAQSLLASRSRNGLPGGGLLVDHVHPSFEGHQLIAFSLLEEMVAMKLVSPEAGWRQAAKRRFVTHFESLPELYFNKGQQNLDNLRFWASGQADGPPIESRFPDRGHP